MSTATLHSSLIDGAPYSVGDPVAVEHEGVWREATIGLVERLHGPGRFGLVWALRVAIAKPNGYVFTTVRVDDNGRNHTYRGQVCPSSRGES